MASKLPKRRGTPLPDLKRALVELQAYLDAGKVEEVPEGFYSLEELMKHWSRSYGFVYRQLKEAVANGFCEVRKFKTGRVPKMYYKLKMLPRVV